MNIEHPLFQALSGPVARLWLNARRAGSSPAPGSLRILHFHETPRDAHPLFSRLVKRLREEHGIVGPDDAEALLEGRGAPRSVGRAPCLLTFDDGFKSNYFLAREVLEPLGVRAVFFVCPGLVDLDPALQREAIAGNIRQDISLLDKAELEQELMTWKEIRELAAAGHVVGSHSLSHRRLSEANPAELENEIGKAAALLETRLGRAPRWIAFPFGNISSINYAALALVAKHHRFCRSGVRGLNIPGTPLLGLFSEVLDLRTPLDYQLAAAGGALDFRYRDARRELAVKLAAYKVS